MNSQNIDFCYYHPTQFLVGVCPFCLNEKLLVVAAKQGRRRSHLLRRRSLPEGRGDINRCGKEGNNNVGVRKRMFDLRSLLNRDKRRSARCAEFGSDFQSTSTSLEDSFISIKFEGNGVALWDKSNKSKPFDTTATTTANPNHEALTKEGNRKKTKIDTSVVEHAKTPRGTLRWRRRIGHLLQLVRGKRSKKSSGGASHVDGVGGVVKGRSKGWIRTFTRRRTNKE